MLNHIVVMGRLTKDPEIRYTQSQVPVASFTVAVDRDYGRGENGDRQTDFIDCSAWRQTAEFASKYFQKGSMAVVSGRLQSRQWEDRNGQKRTSWEINVDNIYFGESRRDRDAQASGNFSNNYTQSAPAATSAPKDNGTSFKELSDEDDGDLPF